MTEADWRLFTTLLRFDPVYHGHFKCNLRRLVDYPNLWAYTRELYQWPGVAETVELRAHQGPLLRQPRHHQPDRHRAQGPAARSDAGRTAATGLPAQRRPPRPEIVTCGEHGCALRRDSVGMGCCWCWRAAPPVAVRRRRSRPVVDVQDHVGAVDRERIVGTWQCRDLNPYPDQIDQLVRETYAADGSYHAESRPAPRPPLGRSRGDGAGQLGGRR